MKRNAAVRLIIITPIFMLLANYMVIFAQEYAQSITAWLLGDKKYPFTIHIGASFHHFMLYFNINENVNYERILARHRVHDIAWIALAGVAAVSAAIYFVSQYMLERRFIQRRAWIFYFFFWLNFMVIARLFSYLSVRAFAERGDLANIVHGFKISHWLVFLVIAYISFSMIWNFFANMLPRTYDALKFTSVQDRAALMLWCTAVMFIGFGTEGLFADSDMGHFLSAASIFLIPGVIAACWPLRKRSMHRNKKTISQQLKAMTASFTEPVLTHDLPLGDEAALPHVDIDEAHFLENVNAVLGERDAKIKESQKAIKHKLAKKPK